MACPLCKSDHFYVKDPEDEYETFEFRLKDGAVDFDDAASAGVAPEITADREIFCRRCAWHGPRRKIEP